MTSRERNLAIAVAALLLLVGGYWAITLWGDSADATQSRIAALENAVADQEQQLAFGVRATKKIDDYRSRSLPGNVEVARSLYKAWLLELAEKTVALKQPVVSAGTISPPGRIYRRISLSISGRGTLEQLTSLLVEFYTADLVHQIRSLRVKAIDDSRLLEITLGIDALVIDGAPAAEKLTLKRRELPGGATAEEFAATILGRNVFASANRPPEIASVQTQRTETGKPLSLKLDAKDPDSLDQILFRLAADAPSGASISESGSLRFAATKAGEYRLPVIAVDNGVPAASSQLDVKVVVADPPPQVVTRPEKPAPPPPPKPYYEDGEFAFVTAVIEVNGKRQLWLDVRTSGETLKLLEGDRFEVGRLKATVDRIGFASIEVTAAGERRRFALGENLAQGQKLAPLAASEGL